MAQPSSHSVMMALGDYRFSLETASYQSLTRSVEYRWERNERLGGDVALQYQGRGARLVTLEGVIYPHYKGGLNQITLLRREADQGKPLLMVDGLGYIWGTWAVLRIEESQSTFFSDGVWLKQEFTLELEAYSSDEWPLIGSSS